MSLVSRLAAHRAELEQEVALHPEDAQPASEENALSYLVYNAICDFLDDNLSSIEATDWGGGDAFYDYDQEASGWVDRWAKSHLTSLGRSPERTGTPSSPTSGVEG